MSLLQLARTEVCVTRSTCRPAADDPCRRRCLVGRKRHLENPSTWSRGARMLGTIKLVCNIIRFLSEHRSHRYFCGAMGVRTRPLTNCAQATVGHASGARTVIAWAAQPNEPGQLAGRPSTGPAGQVSRSAKRLSCILRSRLSGPAATRVNPGSVSGVHACSTTSRGPLHHRDRLFM